MKRHIKSLIDSRTYNDGSSSIDITSAQKLNVQEIKTKIWNAASAKMEDMGFSVDEIPDYLFVEVKQSDDHIRVEVRAELTYSGLTKLTNELDPIVQSFDKDSYFEPVEPGIAEAYIWNTPGVTPSTIKASTEGYVYTHCDECGKKNRVKVTFNNFNEPFNDTEFKCKYCGTYNLLTDPHSYDEDGNIFNCDEIYSAYDVTDSDDALWEVIDDEEFEFRGVQDVAYDNNGNIMVIFNHVISEDMIELLAEELLTAFRQYGYTVHDWSTNGSNVYILTT